RIAAEELNCQNTVETKELAPGVAPPQLWKEIRAHHRVKDLVLVGHEPQLSRVAGFLLESPLAIDLKKGALMKIAVEDNQGPPRRPKVAVDPQARPKPLTPLTAT